VLQLTCPTRWRRQLPYTAWRHCILFITLVYIGFFESECSNKLAEVSDICNKKRQTTKLNDCFYCRTMSNVGDVAIKRPSTERYPKSQHDLQRVLLLPVLLALIKNVATFVHIDCAQNEEVSDTFVDVIIWPVVDLKCLAFDHFWLSLFPLATEITSYEELPPNQRWFQF